jgi:hypothetical protein
MATLAIASPDSFSDRFYCGIFATESPRPGKDFTGGNRENGGRKGESGMRNAECGIFYSKRRKPQVDLFNRRERAGGKWIAGRLKPWKLDIFQAFAIVAHALMGDSFSAAYIKASFQLGGHDLQLEKDHEKTGKIQLYPFKIGD